MATNSDARSYKKPPMIAASAVGVMSVCSV